MSISEELQNYREKLTDVYAKLEERGGTLPEQKNLANVPAVIDTISGGGGGSEKRYDTVRFFDYDGTVVFSCSLAQANKLTELPPLPEHDHLVAEEWTYTLEEVQNTDIPLDIGVHYHNKEDGPVKVDSTVIYIYPNFGTSTTFRFSQDREYAFTIDWGDGTSENSGTTVDKTFSINHTYKWADCNGDTPLRMVINVEDDAQVYLGGNDGDSFVWYSGWPMMDVVLGPKTILGTAAFFYPQTTAGNQFPPVRSLVVLNGVERFPSNCFTFSKGFNHVTFPNSVNYLRGFNQCTSLRSVVIPRNVTLGTSAFELDYIDSVVIPHGTIIGGEFIFRNNKILKNVVMADDIKFQRVDTNPRCTFMYCYGLEHIDLPAGIDYSSDTEGMFEYCYNLKSVTGLDSTKSLNGSMFQSCAFEEINFPNATSVSSSTFKECAALREAYLPKVTSFYSNSFYWCGALKKITMNYAAMSSIYPDTIFQCCAALEEVVLVGFGDGVRNIASALNMFKASTSNLNNIRKFDLTDAKAVPTVSSTSLSNVSKKAKFYVPANLYEEWCQAQYWSTYAERIVPVEINTEE